VTPSPAYDIAAWRGRIPLLGSLVPMNNCSQAPQTDLTRAAAERYLDSWNQSGMDWDAWIDEVQLAKQEFAALINASVDEVALFTSVSEATSAVASALEFSKTRNRVLVTEAEFPTIGHVWLAQERRGARVDWVPVRDGQIDPADYAPRLDETTAVVSACHGYYLNGFTQDVSVIAAQAHDAGALLYVDGYQTVGTVPIDVKAMGADFLAAGNLKYLMGVPGIAFLYVRRELIERLHPLVTGWFGRANPFAFQVNRLDWSPTASRFDTGTPPIAATYIARAGMSIINSVGPRKIRAWVEVLGQRLIDGAIDRGLTINGTTDMSRKTASTAFVVSDSHAVEVAMRRSGVLPSARGPVIRLAPHFYNTIEDVDVALDVLTAVVAKS
jgi:selenocysteine lyase/cysteine desulfurase